MADDEFFDAFDTSQHGMSPPGSPIPRVALPSGFRAADDGTLKEGVEEDALDVPDRPTVEELGLRDSASPASNPRPVSTSTGGSDPPDDDGLLDAFAAEDASDRSINDYLGESTGESHAEAGSARDRYTVINQDTGEQFHIDQMDSHVNTSYSLLPSRADLRHAGRDAGSDDEGSNSSPSRSGTSPTAGRGSRFSRFKQLLGQVKDGEQGRIAFARHKRDVRFAGLRLNQALDAHPTQIWKLEFNKTGSFLASAGHDHTVRIWRVINHQDALDEMRRTEERRRRSALARGVRIQIPHEPRDQQARVKARDLRPNHASIAEGAVFRPLFHENPHRIFEGHDNDVIDLSWSHSNFLLTASMDSSVRLWHVSRDECLHIFWHSDTVTSVHFHPKKDRYFLSGCWDRKLRLWSIETKRVKEWAQTNDVPVTAKFSPAGDRVVAGLMYGQVFIFNFDANGLRYFTQLECRNRQGKHRNGTKVTGIEFVRNSSPPHSTQRVVGGQYDMLVTTNDSRLRYFNMYDFTQIAKYKGLRNTKLLIRARISEDGEHIISGSEDGNVVIWDTLARDAPRFMQRRDRNISYEYFRATRGEEGVVCDALFAPTPAAFCMMQLNNMDARRDEGLDAQVIVTADFEGKIRVFSRFEDQPSGD